MPNTSTIDPLLKDVYGPAIREELTNQVPLLSQFEEAEDMAFEGRQIIEPVHVARNQSVVALREGAAPPTAGQQKYENLKITPTYLYGGISLTKQAMNASRSSKGAFGRVMRLEMNGLVQDFRIKLNRMLAGYGSGVLAFISTDPVTGTTVAVDSPGGVAGATNGSRFIHEGMTVAFLDANTLTLQAGGTRTVATVPAAGTSFTVTAAMNTGTEDNDLIVAAYGADASLTIGNTSYMCEPMGILGMDDDGTYLNNYFGLNRATYPILKSTIFSSVGALSADILQRAVDVTTQQFGKAPSTHLMHPSVRRAYLALSEADRRYTLGKLMNPDVGTEAAKGGESTVDFGGSPLKVDWALPYGMWFGWQKDGAYRYPVDPGSWIDDDGSVLFRSSTAVDTFDAQYRMHLNFAHVYPISMFRLDGITASVVVVRVR